LIPAAPPHSHAESTYSVIAEAQRGQLHARAGDVRPDATAPPH
jgi:hypothetical protein